MSSFMWTESLTRAQAAMNDDAELLRAHVEHGFESAFAAIVERHQGLVIASAPRQTGEPGLAEEITRPSLSCSRARRPRSSPALCFRAGCFARRVSPRPTPSRANAGEQNGVDTLQSIEPLPDADRIPAARDAVESREWCDFGVVAQGSRFVIQLNGVTVTDTRDEHPSKFVPRDRKSVV